MLTKIKGGVAAFAIALLAAVLALGAPTVALADGAVAKIGDTEYATFDEAVKAAKNGDTVTLLADCTTDAGLNLSKSLTVQGSGSETLTFAKYGIALWGKALTFKDCKVSMTGIGSTPYTAEWGWMAVCASQGASMTLDNVTMTMDGTGAGNAHAIYFTGNNKLNVQNGSTLKITNYKQDALEWDGGDGGYNVNITDSTYIADHNRSGITGTFYATINNSTVKVINSTGNGSNGSNFVIKNKSNVDFSNNGSNGLSASTLSIDNSTVTANKNGANGIHTTGTMTISNGSNVTVTGNGCTISSKWTIPGAIHVGSGASSISGSTVTITDNGGSGIYQKSASGSLTVDDSATLTVMRNTATKLGFGGGIYVNGTVSLGSGTSLYNNHAGTAGDDIYVKDGGGITFGATKGGWKLDGDTDGIGCSHAINGWYDDAEGSRWDAHSSDKPHMDKVEPGKLTGVVALKAAHNLVKTNYVWVSTDNPSDVTPPADDSKLVPGTECTVKAQDPTSDTSVNWTFNGWYTAYYGQVEGATSGAKIALPFVTIAYAAPASNGLSGDYYAGGTTFTIMSDTTFYGEWTRTVTVDYKWVSTDNPSDVQPPASDEDLEYGTAYTAKAQDSSDGWIFDGWYTDEACTHKFADGTALTANTTLYGKWSKEPEKPSSKPKATHKTRRGPLAQTSDNSIPMGVIALVGIAGVAAVAGGVKLSKREH